MLGGRYEFGGGDRAPSVEAVACWSLWPHRRPTTVKNQSRQFVEQRDPNAPYKPIIVQDRLANSRQKYANVSKLDYGATSASHRYSDGSVKITCRRRARSACCFGTGTRPGATWMKEARASPPVAAGHSCRRDAGRPARSLLHMLPPRGAGRRSPVIGTPVPLITPMPRGPRSQIVNRMRPRTCVAKIAQPYRRSSIVLIAHCARTCTGLAGPPAW